MFRFFRAYMLFLICIAGWASAGAGAARQDKPKAESNRPALEHTLPSAATELAIRQGLVAGLLGSYGRSAVPSDFLAWQIATGHFAAPSEGDTLGLGTSKIGRRASARM